MTFVEKLARFASVVETEQKERAARTFPGYEVAKIKVVILPGKKYIKVDIIDVQQSGRFLITQDGEIYGIKAYGVIHRGHHYGNLDTINEWYWGGYYPSKK